VRPIDADALIAEFDDYIKFLENRDFVTSRFYADGARVLRKTVEKAPTIEQPTWIPVTERLPCESERVLIFDGWGDIHIAEFFGEDVKRMWLCSEWWYSQASVTHWMPLPEPPKGDE
jgi:hypothetical protein